MTLQQIADYAMEYLDGKGVAADYNIDSDFTLTVCSDIGIFVVDKSDQIDKQEVEVLCREFLI